MLARINTRSNKTLQRLRVTEDNGNPIVQSPEAFALAVPLCVGTTCAVQREVLNKLPKQIPGKKGPHLLIVSCRGLD